MLGDADDDDDDDDESPSPTKVLSIRFDTTSWLQYGGAAERTRRGHRAGARVRLASGPGRSWHSGPVLCAAGRILRHRGGWSKAQASPERQKVRDVFIRLTSAWPFSPGYAVMWLRGSLDDVKKQSLMPSQHKHLLILQESSDGRDQKRFLMVKRRVDKTKIEWDLRFHLPRAGDCQQLGRHRRLSKQFG